MKDSKIKVKQKELNKIINFNNWNYKGFEKEKQLNSNKNGDKQVNKNNYVNLSGSVKKKGVGKVN